MVASSASASGRSERRGGGPGRVIERLAGGGMGDENVPQGKFPKYIVGKIGASANQVVPVPL